MSSPPRTIAIYNPGRLGKDDLIATFSARRPLLDALLDDVRRGGKQHHLIIGQRGAGKTTLLLRLAYAIEDDPELARRAIALRFPEEQYNVARLSDFWLNCVDALTDVLERDDAAAARTLDAEVDRIDELDEEGRAGAALALLTGWARRSKRLIVLLVDNLDLVLDRLADHHWALREVLSADNRLMLIGASSSHIQESFDYGEAFYDFFNVHELSALSEDEARAMLSNLASATGDERVREALAEPGRFAALHLMSGGMPRTLVLLHRVLASEASSSAEQDLEALLDQVTPYYKARFDELPAQSQLVVHALAMHWHPMTAIECAESARLDVNSVSSQLNRLVRQGIVSKLATPDSAKLSFLISERLFAIWYSMRASRRLRRKLLWLVEAVQALYGQREIDRRAAELLATAAADRGDPARLLAYASKVADAAVRERLEFHAVQGLVNDAFVGSALADLLDVDGEDRHLVPLVDRLRTLDMIGRLLNAVEKTWTASVSPQELSRLVRHSALLSLAEKATFTVALCNESTASRAGHATYRRNVDVVVEALLAATPLYDDNPAFAAAVERGELPSVRDFRSLAEVARMLSLMPDGVWRDVIVALIVMYADGLDDEALAALFASRPALPAYLVRRAAVVASSDPDAGMRELARALRAQTIATIEHVAVPALWRSFVRANVAARAAAVLRESGWHEHVLPLYAALLGAAEGRRGELAQLAPEVRRVAEEILAELLAPGPAVEAQPTLMPYRLPLGTASRAAEPTRRRSVRRAPRKKGYA